jgi:hypothetical protein
MGMLRNSLAVVAWLIVFATFATPRAGAAEVLVYNVSARIDGSSDFLIFHRNTVQWHHTGTVAAPGRQGGGSDDPTTISASLNGVTTIDAFPWLPAWSQPFPNQIRFEDYSSSFTSLNPLLPGADVQSVTVSTFSGRGSVVLEQFPTAGNDYTLIAKFADGFNGSAYTAGLITVVVPEPGWVGIGLVGVVVGLFRRRRRGNNRRRPTIAH